MHDRTHLIELRIDRFIHERLEPAVFRESRSLAVTARELPGEPQPFSEATDGAFQPAAAGDAWGRPWGTTWFHVTGAVPQEWRDGAGHLPAQTRPELVIDLGFTPGQSGFQCEGLVWSIGGSPIKGVSPFNNCIAAAVGEDGQIDVYVEAASNPDVGSLFTFEPTQLGDTATAGTAPIYTLRRVDVALRDLTVTGLLADVRVLRSLVAELDATSSRRAEVLHALDRVCDVVDPNDVAGSAAAGRAVLRPLLDRPAHASAHVLHAVGHAHIDSAWLWPVRETVRKVSRTFANVLDLMDEDPDFTFASSSAQQFAWIKEQYPALWERLVARVREGRFIPVGGMWVESDTNLPGGEALARQFVAGKRFFLEEFDIDTPEVWLPDSFGYTAALPQIIRQAGARWFLTQKISWNETNRVPHHTFSWEGIDGTRVFTHFPPVDKYNSDVSAADLAHAEQNFADKGRSTMSLLPYGYGDGGGGPTSEMTGIIARTGSLEASPRVVHSTPSDFFTAAEAEYPDPEVWKGELYLEFHRGTYTSQLRTKQGNRRSEHLLREAELWAATAAVRSEASYPAAQLRRLWELVLLQQFHDILPGSSIAWVHRDAERNYAAIAAELEEIIEASLRALVGSGGGHRVLANAAPQSRAGVQALAIGGSSPAPRVAPRREGADIVLDNGIVRARIDADGCLSSVVDLGRGREMVPPGTRAGVLHLHRDTPTQWDAWDIDITYRRHDLPLDQAESVSIEGDEVVVRRAFGTSSILQRISLDESSRVVQLGFEIDWHETQQLLKLTVPVDVHTDAATSEIQFGHVQRATHTNTSWDAARFETVAHRWVHVGEPDFGVAVTNDSTYGHDITRHARAGGGSFSQIGLSLLRAPLFPDPTHDEGQYRLQVGIVVGAEIEDAVAEGYRANLAPRVIEGAEVEAVEALVGFTDPGIVVEAVKLAEDGSGDVIVRAYEALGRRASGAVAIGFEASGIELTDLLERPSEDQSALAVYESSEATLTLRPFQLVTLRIRRR